MPMHPVWWEGVILSRRQLADLLRDVHDHHDLVAACRAFIGARRVRAQVEEEIQSIDFRSLREGDVTAFLKGHLALIRAMDGVFAPLNGEPDLPASPVALKSWLFTNLLIFEAASDGLSQRKDEIPDPAHRLVVHFAEAMFFSLIGPPAAAEELRRRGREHAAGALAFEYQLLRDDPGVTEAEIEGLLKRMTKMAAGVLGATGRDEVRRLHGTRPDALTTLWGAVHEVVARAVTGDPLEILSDGRPGRFDILPRRIAERSLEHLRKNTEQTPLVCNECGHVWSRRAKRRAGECPNPKCGSKNIGNGAVMPWRELGSDRDQKDDP